MKHVSIIYLTKYVKRNTIVDESKGQKTNRSSNQKRIKPAQYVKLSDT